MLLLWSSSILAAGSSRVLLVVVQTSWRILTTCKQNMEICTKLAKNRNPINIFTQAFSANLEKEKFKEVQQISQIIPIA
jgi:hypothetical protein